jgi:DNA-binding response OmpR family regulator
VKKKILFVDDEPDILKVSVFMLKRMGYEAFGALNGQKAMDLVRQKIPDLIVLDVYLPGMKGDEIAGLLKKDKTTQGIPIILISADLTTLEARSRLCGADDYLGKPFEVQDLLNMIKKYTSKKNPLRKTGPHKSKAILSGPAKPKKPS